MSKTWAIIAVLVCGCGNNNPRGFDVEVFRCRITRIVPWQIGRWPTIEEELCPKFSLPEKEEKFEPCPKTRKFYDGTGLPALEWMRE